MNAILWKPPADFGAILLERTTLLMRMRRCQLDLKWVKEFSLSQLWNCCERMERRLSDVTVTDKTLQRELIGNPAFVVFYQELLARFRAVTSEQTAPEPAASGQPAYSAGPQVRNERVDLNGRLIHLLGLCQAAGVDITAFPMENILETLLLTSQYKAHYLVYLKNFAPLKLSEEPQQTVLRNLDNCLKVPLELSDGQRELLMQPFTGTRALFRSADFDQVWALLSEQPALVQIAAFLHEIDVEEELTLADYRTFCQQPETLHELLQKVLGQMDTPTAGNFLDFWRGGGCPLYELQKMEHRLAENPELDLAQEFANYPGYINLLYGRRFQKIDLSSVAQFQEEILIYAIINRKTHFIRLVDEHAELFLRLPRSSMLFDRKLYRDHLNLNEMTVKDLQDCEWMLSHYMPSSSLALKRHYTFQELRTLYQLPVAYIYLYDSLPQERQDDRIKVIKQLIKRDVLNWSLTTEETGCLAACLGKKPLYDWMQQDFGHITGLTAASAIQILLHLDKLEAVLPTMRDEIDVLLALRCLEHMDQYSSIAELKASLLYTDSDWLRLCRDMGLSEPFLEEHREQILRFLAQNGAHVVMTYRRCLDDAHDKAYLRVVKAELMGKLKELKYFEDDLQRELDIPIRENVKEHWMENTSMERKGIEVREHDDFLSTMLLGVRPQRTCLSYLDGQHRECLLAGFDSNKKVLYASYNGRIVGRAYLRLTKGRLKNSGDRKPDDFTFVDLENIDATRHTFSTEEEYLTLFLERPYISGVSPEITQRIQAAFVALVSRKADDMGAMLVLSCDYQDLRTEDFVYTRFYIYISKSKAGAQYLDSLNGHASVSDEGSYHSNRFMVRRRRLGIPQADVEEE